ncbi:hypothetical protein ACFU99_43180, partial [Streptomyces sp. NPDC057654]
MTSARQDGARARWGGEAAGQGDTRFRWSGASVGRGDAGARPGETPTRQDDARVRWDETPARQADAWPQWGEASALETEVAVRLPSRPGAAPARPEEAGVPAPVRRWGRRAARQRPAPAPPTAPPRPLPVPRHRIGPVLHALLLLGRRSGPAELARRLAELVHAVDALGAPLPEAPTALGDAERDGAWGASGSRGARRGAAGPSVRPDERIVPPADDAWTVTTDGRLLRAPGGKGAWAASAGWGARPGGPGEAPGDDPPVRADERAVPSPHGARREEATGDGPPVRADERAVPSRPASAGWGARRRATGGGEPSGTAAGREAAAGNEPAAQAVAGERRASAA